MPSKTVIGNSPAMRRRIITLALRTYTEAGVLASHYYEEQSRRWVIETPNGATFIYGLQQIEAFIAGVQAFAERLSLSPLTLEHRYSDAEWAAMREECEEDDDVPASATEHPDDPGF